MKIFTYPIIALSLCSCNNNDISTPSKTSKDELIPQPGYDFKAEKDAPIVGDYLILYDHSKGFLKRKFGCDSCRFKVTDLFFRKEVGQSFVIQPEFKHSDDSLFYSISTGYVKDGFLLAGFWEWSEYPHDTISKVYDPWFSADGQCISDYDIVFFIE